MITRTADFHLKWTTIGSQAESGKGNQCAERLAQIDEGELAGMLWENSDEPYAEELAHAIVTERKHGKPIDTTTRLREVIEETLSFLPEKGEKGYG